MNKLAMGEPFQSTLNAKLSGQGTGEWRRSGVLFFSMDTNLAQISASKE